jgi:AAA+ ATPase superfamily predicted ATPase
MQLYFREKQLAFLDKAFDSVNGGSNFVLLFGKRRVGKTTLVAEHLRRRRGAYITVSSKSSVLQLHEISDYLKSFNFTESFVPAFRNWKEFFEFAFYLAKEQTVNLAIDEFQNFEKLEPDFYSELKKLWDKYSRTSNLNLIVIASDQNFIQRTFSSTSSPLYDLNRFNLKLEPFRFSEVTGIMQMHNSILPLDEIIKIYLVFGGLPKYYALIDQFGLWNNTVTEILRELVFKRFAPLGYELNELVVNDFSRSNTVYLSILQAIAAGYRTVSEISKFISIPATSVVKYTTELEKKKGLVKRKLPLGTIDCSKSKYGKYYIKNYFDDFWFRFIQPDIISYEMGQYEKMLHSISEQLNAYIQERVAVVVRELLVDKMHHPLVKDLFDSSMFKVGQTWTRDGHFDIVIKNEISGRVVLGKVLTKDFTFSEDYLEEIHQAALSTEKIFQHGKLEELVVIHESPSFDFSNYLEKKNIHSLLLYDILSLSDYRPKQNRTLRSKTPRVRQKEPLRRHIEIDELR